MPGASGAPASLGGLRVLVVGLGVMGRGIARALAGAGAGVLVADADRAATERGLEQLVAEAPGAVAPGPGTIAAGSVAGAAHVDLVIEAVAEDMAVKAALLAELGSAGGPATVVATNTSSLSVAELGRAFGAADRLVGLHFFNPPEKMALVEVVSGPETSPPTLALAHRVVRGLGKEAVDCADSPGFVVNRTCRPLYYEAQLLVAEGVPVPVVDAVARLGLGYRMGPLETLDLTGLHVHLAASQTALAEFGDPRYRPLPVVRRLVRAGHTGRAAGQGFYRYADGRPRQQMEGVVRPPGAPAPLEVVGPGAHRWAHLVRPGHPDAPGGTGTAGPGAVLYACAGAATDHDVAAVAELARTGRVAVASSDGRWLDDLPVGSAWLHLHRGPDGLLAEVVNDAEAGRPCPPWAQSVLGALEARWVPVPALAGLVGDRLRCTMVNEATLLVEEGLARAEDVDRALRLGMGHPHGPFQVLEDLGVPAVCDCLAALQRATGDPRYRPSSLLRRWAARHRLGSAA